jgi:ADP-dependent NAD(P)H-hydrate dehydratase / NAD(P)H-hydrate epimerase
MIEAWSAEDVRTAEAALMSDLPEGELMARAAAGLAAVADVRLEERGAQRVVVLVGPGNNGGDALYAAAHLAERGRAVVCVRGDWPVHQGGLAAAEEAGAAVLGPGGPWQEALDGAELVLDGLLGIGGRPGLPEQAQPWVDAIPDEAFVLAVDLPSGQDPAGEALTPDAVFADETVTFGVPKPVHLLPATEAAVGQLTVVDIGLVVHARPAVQRVTRDDVPRLWPVPSAGDDKYSRGVLGVIAGGEQYTGAAVLCCTAAVCSGVGMVRYLGPPNPTGLVRATVPEAVVGDGKVQAWVIGPGLDTQATGPAATEQLAAAGRALASDLPVLLDAGALELLNGQRLPPTLLTPHAGELARLLTRLTEEEVTREDVQGDPVAAARRAAGLTGATVLLKGSTTLVVPPPGTGLPVRTQNDAPAWLATAGAGDVLAGLAGTLLAAGLSPLDAGSLAALVHGVAADAANPGGPVRALAVAHGIPAAVAALLAR